MPLYKTPTIPPSCGCPPPLRRVVLGTESLYGGGQRAVACLGCGDLRAWVHLSEQIPGDPRDASEVVGWEPIELDEQSSRWIAGWPRVAGDPSAEATIEHEVVFLPATSRFADEAALLAAEADARRAQTGVLYSQRLRAAGIPSGPPPASLPRKPWFFLATWEALHLADDTPLRDLFDRASDLRLPASWVAREKLPRGDALIAGIATLVGDARPEVRHIGLSALSHLRVGPGPIEIPEAVLIAAAARIGEMAAAADAEGCRYLTYVLTFHDPSSAARLEALVRSDAR